MYSQLVDSQSLGMAKFLENFTSNTLIITCIYFVSFCAVMTKECTITITLD